MNIRRSIWLVFAAIFLGFVAEAAPQEGSTGGTLYPAISFDFLTNQLDASQIRDLRLQHGQGVRLHVRNFNPFLYNLTINGQVISYNQNIPELFSAALTGGAPAQKPLMQDVGPIDENIVAAIDSLPREYRATLLTYQEALRDTYQKLQGAESIVLSSVGNSDDLEKGEILNKIKKDLNALCKTVPELESPDDLSNALSEKIDTVKLVWDMLNAKYNKLSSSDKASAKDEFEAEKKHWSTFEKTDAAVLAKALSNAISTWRAVNESKFEIWGGPFFANGDELVIKVTASRKAGIDARFQTSRVYTDKQVIRLRVKGGIKLDFSTGFIFGWPTDRIYELRKNADGQNVIVRSKQSESLVAAAPGLFLHFYPRSGRDVALAGTFGIAANKSTAFDYYLGGSALFGSSQRLALTVGIGMRTISTISGKYQVNDILPTDVGTIPLVNVIHFGICFGLSFNLGGV